MCPPRRSGLQGQVSTLAGLGQACKCWHDIRHACIWIGHHYCMSMFACQYNQPKRPRDLDLWPFNLEIGVRVTCEVGYLCANFVLPRPLHSPVIPVVHDRQTDVRQHRRLMLGLLSVKFGELYNVEWRQCWSCTFSVIHTYLGVLVAVW